MNLSFTGEYKYSIDQKSRLNIPAKFRKALDPKNSNTFVITRGFDPSLILYPIVEWQKVEQQLLLLSSIKNKDRSFVRSIVRYATIAKYDSQGRIQIPENLLEYSNIQKEVLIIGMINKIEIWNKSDLDKIEKQSLSNADDTFEDLANEIKF
ncbi:MAG: division/cell wall cluster transcriptional repressor MraZ [Candidatus Marinimicrobia bacterium]|nr:division/cell wall cluster transcriptional repressor MraZ [Candidatus Neomarinimicrobiota bacterium]|tara:strand:+ start:699 stop:1154 length:456 start_codon:yes stop_codon:yes gene_type:complete